MGKRSRTAPSQEAETTDLVVVPSQPETNESDAGMTQEASSSKKRTGRGEAATTKKAKKNVEESEKEEKPPRQKAPGQKLFTDDDVKFLLKALDEKDAGAKFDIYESVKSSLSQAFTREQVIEKLGRLKNKRKNSKSNNPVQLPIEDLDFEEELIKKVSGLVGLPESRMTQVLESIDPAERAELNSRWVKMTFAEAELVTKKTMLLGDLIKLVSNAYEQF